MLTRTILLVKPGQPRVDDDCFPICLIGQIGCPRSRAPFVCEIIRPHHPSRTQNPGTMPGLRANSTSQYPPSGRRVQNIPELDAHRGCLNRVLPCSGLEYIATVCLRLFVQKLHRKLHTLIHWSRWTRSRQSACLSKIAVEVLTRLRPIHANFAKGNEQNNRWLRRQMFLFLHN